MRRSFYWDEVANLPVYRRGPVEIIRHTLTEAKPLRPPLFGILQHYWMLLFGESETALRSLSLLLMALSFALCQVLASRSLGPRGGRVGAILFALSPAMVLWGGFANWAPLMMAIVLLCNIALLRVEEDRRFAPLLGVSSLAALYTSYYAIPMLIAHTAYLLLFKPPGRRSALIAIGIAVVVFAPWLPKVLMDQEVIRGYATPPRAVGWLRTVGYVLYSFTLGEALLPSHAALLAAFGAGVGLLLFLSARSAPRRVVVLWSLQIGCVLLAGLGSGSLDSYRAFPFMPLFLLTVAAGAPDPRGSIPRRSILALALMAPALLLALHHTLAGREYLRIGMLEPWRKIESDLRATLTPADVVVHASGVFAHYMEKRPLPARVLRQEALHPDDIASAGRVFFLKGFDSYWAEANRTGDQVLETLSGHCRLINRKTYLEDPSWRTKARWGRGWPFQKDKLVLREFDCR